MDNPHGQGEREAIVRKYATHPVINLNKTPARKVLPKVVITNNYNGRSIVAEVLRQATLVLITLNGNHQHPSRLTLFISGQVIANQGENLGPMPK